VKDNQNEPKTLTPEQEMILMTKKELEFLYKEFIKCVFHEPTIGILFNNTK